MQAETERTDFKIKAVAAVAAVALLLPLGPILRTETNPGWVEWVDPES
jgi:hypothetical protein